MSTTGASTMSTPRVALPRTARADLTQLKVHTYDSRRPATTAGGGADNPNKTGTTVASNNKELTRLDREIRRLRARLKVARQRMAAAGITAQKRHSLDEDIDVSVQSFVSSGKGVGVVEDDVFGSEVASEFIPGTDTVGTASIAEDNHSVLTGGEIEDNVGSGSVVMSVLQEDIASEVVASDVPSTDGIADDIIADSIIDGGSAIDDGAIPDDIVDVGSGANSDVGDDVIDEIDLSDTELNQKIDDIVEEEIFTHGSRRTSASIDSSPQTSVLVRSIDRSHHDSQIHSVLSGVAQSIDVMGSILDVVHSGAFGQSPQPERPVHDQPPQEVRIDDFIDDDVAVVAEDSDDDNAQGSSLIHARSPSPHHYPNLVSPTNRVVDDLVAVPVNDDAVGNEVPNADEEIIDDDIEDLVDFDELAETRHRQLDATAVVAVVPTPVVDELVEVPEEEDTLIEEGRAHLVAGPTYDVKSEKDEEPNSIPTTRSSTDSVEDSSDDLATSASELSDVSSYDSHDLDETVFRMGWRRALYGDASSQDATTEQSSGDIDVHLRRCYRPYKSTVSLYKQREVRRFPSQNHPPTRQRHHPFALPLDAGRERWVSNHVRLIDTLLRPEHSAEESKF